MAFPAPAELSKLQKLILGVLVVSRNPQVDRYPLKLLFQARKGSKRGAVFDTLLLVPKYPIETSFLGRRIRTPFLIPSDELSEREVENLKVVYLDQNKWIEIARVFHRKTNDPTVKAAFDSIQELSRQGAAIFPLSSVHYMETAKSTNHDRRKRLGTVMWEISCGHTIASHSEIIRFELESALIRRFPHITPRGFELISKGYAHAFNVEHAYKVPEELRRNLPASVIEAFEKEGQTVLEEAAITGEGPDGTRMPSLNFNQSNKLFVQHLKTLPQRDALLDSGKREDFLHASALKDIIEPVNEVLAFHGLSLERDLLPLEAEGLTSLIQDMPSRKTEVHLHRQIIKNPNLKPKDNDLEDWSGLGPATSHCDVVVCENHFADLLSRDGYQPNARVITDVRDLSEVLQDLE